MPNPLKQGYSRKTFNDNVSLMMKEGYQKNQALRIAYDTARKSYRKRYPKGALPEWLRERKNNPVPASSKAAIKEAQELFSDFTGHDGKNIGKVKLPSHKAGVVIGDCDGILYTTVRDGETESYIHKFKKNSRPLLIASHDGKTLYLIGGSFTFTDRGIVDR